MLTIVHELGVVYYDLHSVHYIWFSNFMSVNGDDIEDMALFFDHL